MQLRPYQTLALKCAWDYLRNAEGNPAIVLPTGAGKSPLMAAMAQDAVQQWGGRVGILAHRQELVEQNAAKMLAVWPGAPMGIYAAGLKRKDRFDPILFMQIQSVAKHAQKLGNFDLLLIDEAHGIALSGDGMYRSFIADCRAMNPALRVVGVTATPYRLQGQAVPVCGPDNVLNEIAYEARIPDLIAGGYLSRLVSKAGECPDLAGVHTRGGEFIETELASVMSDDELVQRTVVDMLGRSHGRKAGIVFCVNVGHAEKVLARLHDAGESAAMVHQGSSKGDRAAAIAAFQQSNLRWMVNVNILSEGFDAPHIDVVAMLRPTKSPGLMYQQCGRGLRIAPGKADCLILDYAMNLITHGPIDEIRVKSARPGKAAAVVTGTVKECPACAALVPIQTRLCECGHSWLSEGANHLASPTGAAVLSTERERIIGEYPVDSISYKRHTKVGKPDSMKVTYQCGLMRFNEWVCIEHRGFAQERAIQWWQHRANGGAIPRTVNEALEHAYSLPTPTHVTADTTDKMHSVVGYRFAEQTPKVDTTPEPTNLDRAPSWLRDALKEAA